MTGKNKTRKKINTDTDIGTDIATGKKADSLQTCTHAHLAHTNQVLNAATAIQLVRIVSCVSPVLLSLPLSLPLSLSLSNPPRPPVEKVK